MATTENELQDLLADLLCEDASHVSTFTDAGIMTNNKGVVVTFESGAEFQVTIVQSAYVDDDDDDEDEDDEMHACGACGQLVDDDGDEIDGSPHDCPLDDTFVPTAAQADTLSIPTGLRDADGNAASPVHHDVAVIAAHRA